MISRNSFPRNSQEISPAVRPAHRSLATQTSPGVLRRPFRWVGLLGGFLLLLAPLSAPAGAAPGSAPTEEVSAQGGRFHLQEATIGDAHAAMRSRQLTCRQLVQLYLDRIEAYDKQGPALNAIMTLNPAALEQADRLDARFAASGMAGPLHCVPVLVKDEVETKDISTSYGSAIFRDFMPPQNATVIDRIEAAGAIILAKNTMSEFADAGYMGSAFGFCRNAYFPDRIPGGSSCGTGAGVAANFGAVGVGEDTGGSIRNPSSYHGLVGLRPTLGLISRNGVQPAQPTRDTLGPMARTVRDAALLLDAMAGYDPSDPVTAYSVGRIPTTYTSFLTANGLQGKRLGVIRDPIGAGIDTGSNDFQQTRAALDRALSDMAGRGAVIVDSVPAASMLGILGQTGRGGEQEAAVNKWLATLPNAPVKTMRDIVLSSDSLMHPAHRIAMAAPLGLTTNDAPYLQAQAKREELRQEVLKTMADYNLDALLFTSIDLYPPLIPADIMTSTASRGSPGANSGLAPALGFPALTVPAGVTEDGFNVGIQLLGRPFSEGTLFQIAYGYEQTGPHRQAPETVPPLPNEP